MKNKIVIFCLVFGMLLVINGIVIGGVINFGDTKEITYSKESLSVGFQNPDKKYRINLRDHKFGSRGTNAESIAKRYLEQGYGSVETNVIWDKSYVDKQSNFKTLSDSLETLDKVGLKYWIYDELGYPGGMAGGRTTKDNPNFVAKGLVKIFTMGEGMTPATLNKPSDVSKIYTAYAADSKGKTYPAKIDGDKVTFKGMDGVWTLYLFCEKKLYEGTHAENNGWMGIDWLTRDYLNIMDKNAVNKFIDVTYKNYYNNLKQFKNIIGFNNEEASLIECYQNTTNTYKYAQISWVDGFPEKFKEMHGYDINQKLNYIFDGNSEEAKMVRLNYRQTIAELVSKNFYKQISDYCKSVGTKSSGHLLLEESIEQHVVYYGDLMKSVRELGIPGVDILIGSPTTYMEKSYAPWFMASKYVASTARVAGKADLVWAEVCPTEVNLSIYSEKKAVNELRGMTNLSFFAGVNQIDSYIEPSFFGENLRDFNDYFARLSYITRNSKWDSEIGMYYPINTVQMDILPSTSWDIRTPESNEVSESIQDITLGLYKNQMDYNMIDNQFIREAKISKGKLTANGISFKVIVMPVVEAMPYDVLKKLVDFQNQGGKVIWISKTPVMGDKLSDSKKITELSKSFKTEKISDDLFKKIKTYVGDKLNVEGSLDNIYISKYVTKGATMYWILNNSPQQNQINLKMDGKVSFDICDPTTGKITSTNNVTQMNLEGYTTQFLIVKS